MAIGNTFCDASTNLTIKWWDKPPFFMNPQQGAILNILLRMIKSCCSRASLNYVYLNASAGESDEYSGSGADFFVPISRDAQGSAYEEEDQNSYFIPVIHSPGFCFLVDNDQVKSVILELLIQMWPLLVIILLSVAYAGILIWALDSYWNPEQFPRSFLTGFSEGVWWAIVTMTTVGYGDKTPRSLPARLFSFVWVLTGVVILSLFTATMTTSLTSDVSDFTLKGKNTGCIKNTESYKYALIHGAKVKEFDTITDLLTSFKADKTMDGIILDAFEALHLTKQLEKSNIKASTDILHEIVYGILVQSVDEQLADCYKHVARRHRNRVYTELKKDLDEPEEENASVHVMSRLISPLQLIFMIVALVGLILLFIILLSVDYFYCRRKKDKKPEYWSQKVSEQASEKLLRDD